MTKLMVNCERCKGCLLCKKECPVNAISISNKINEKGYQVIEVDETKCKKCGICISVCPDYVFEIV